MARALQGAAWPRARMAGSFQSSPLQTHRELHLEETGHASACPLRLFRYPTIMGLRTFPGLELLECIVVHTKLVLAVDDSAFFVATLYPGHR